MKRRNWLIATLAALFVLQAPLCVFACLPSSAPDESTVETRPASPPCHEENPTSAPREPAGTHDECGCDDADAVVLASADPTFSNTQTSHFIPPADALPVTAVSSRTLEVQLSEADLPPPDILLLKATLLI